MASFITTYHYDGASRLTEIDYSNASGSSGNLIYQYDAAGHRTGMGGSLAQITLPAAVSYDGSGQRIATQINTVQPQFQLDGANVDSFVQTMRARWKTRKPWLSLAAKFGPPLATRIGPLIKTQPDSFVLAGFDRLEGAAGWIGEPKWNYTRRSGASTLKASEQF